ncbi:MAG: AMP phosphorylase [Candidatus Nanoarchaeia archaeon]
MKLRVKDLAISTGNQKIALLNHKDAEKYDLHFTDRIRIKNGKKEVTAIIDITDSQELLLPGQIGLFKEVYSAIDAKDDDVTRISIEQKPKSVEHIKKKLKGKELKYNEMEDIVNDIVYGKLSEIELTYFVSSTYVYEMTDNEIIHLINCIIKSGDTLNLSEKTILDKHCIGGVAGNRTTMIVVPIIAAAGLIMPKTSSRSITSAAGTADTVEVLCEVSYPIEDMKKTVKSTGACLMWGGAMNLAPADDKIIKVEYPVSLDPIGQLLASILAKKKSVSATHVLIDIPVGPGCKTDCMDRAKHLKNKFEEIGKKINMKVQVEITDGSQPIGNGIGPALEARDVLWTLQNSENAAIDLKNKSIRLAGKIFELVGEQKKGHGWRKAKKLIENGDAYKKFIEIIKKQGAKITTPENIKLGRYKKTICSGKEGIILHIDNKGINKVARIAGAPHDQKAGLYLHVHKYNKVKKGQELITIYADSKERLKFAEECFSCDKIIHIEKKSKKPLYKKTRNTKAK